nr:hypothetical protein [Cupriavidus gilardii]
MTFEEVEERGKPGIRIRETLVIAYNDSIGTTLSERYHSLFDRLFRAAETCQFSIVGTNAYSSGSDITLKGDFKLRKCISADYPCGETCEIRWDYQACRTVMCRATAITDLMSGEVSARISHALEPKRPASITITPTASITPDLSRGDIAEALRRAGIDGARLAGGVQIPEIQLPPETVHIPQDAFIYKPEVDSVSWVNVDRGEFPEQSSLAIQVLRSQPHPVERTAACAWIACRRSGDADQCKAGR